MARRTRTKGIPVPRQEVFDLYWHFVYERHAIFERRVAGQPHPWTDDPILDEYKFCCVYRACDRVSQYLIRDVAYGDPQARPEDVIFRIAAFRTFSRIETWEQVSRHLGRQPIIADLADGSFLEALEATKAENGGLYTGAFILCATRAYGHAEKHRNHVDLFEDMFVKNSLAERILAAPSLGVIFEMLRGFPLMGDFMSYQTAIDFNYSAHVNFSESEFTKAGPGALRGIKKAFSDMAGNTPEDIIMWMVENQDREFARMGLDFGGLYGRPLQAIDAQNVFCELDKYCREAVPELKSARSRIKARYKGSAGAMDLFFPPKWGLTLPEGAGLRADASDPPLAPPRRRVAPPPVSAAVMEQTELF